MLLSTTNAPSKYFGSQTVGLCINSSVQQATLLDNLGQSSPLPLLPHFPRNLRLVPAFSYHPLSEPRSPATSPRLHLDYQVQGIKCIGFGQKRHSEIPSDLIQRCSRVGVSVVRESAEGFHPISLWPHSLPLILAEEIEPQQFKLSLVTAVVAGGGGGHEVRGLIYLTPLPIQEFYTLVDFVLSYHKWCG